MPSPDGFENADDLTVIADSIHRQESAVNPDTHPVPQDPMIGRSLDGGKYKVIGILGRGGMSIVYKAQQELVGRYVAIKTLTVQLLGDPTIVRRFTREVQALGKLNHPNIVTAFDCVVDGLGQPYFIMDYLDGVSLSQVLDEEHHLDQARVQRIALQVCSAVACAHDNHIVHRDLKPANIMLLNPGTDEEQVKIVDFGVAKISEDVHKLTATGELWGTPSYMSPEQAHGKFNDHRSDIYSVGCVLFEALTGKPPYEGESQIDTLMMHINNPVPSIEQVAPELGIHPAFDCVVQKALQKDPNMRFQSMKEMGKALNDLNLAAPRPIIPAGGWDSKPAYESTIPGAPISQADAGNGRPGAAMQSSAQIPAPAAQATPAQPTQAPAASAQAPTPPAPAPQPTATALNDGSATHTAAPPPVPSSTVSRARNGVLIACACLTAGLLTVGSWLIFGGATKPAGQAPSVPKPAVAAPQTNGQANNLTAPLQQSSAGAKSMPASNLPVSAQQSGPESTTPVAGNGQAATHEAATSTGFATPATPIKLAQPLRTEPLAPASGPAADNIYDTAGSAHSLAGKTHDEQSKQLAHRIKHAKKHAPAQHSDAQPRIKPLDDIDRWEQFKSGQ